MTDQVIEYLYQRMAEVAPKKQPEIPMVQEKTLNSHANQSPVAAITQELNKQKFNSQPAPFGEMDQEQEYHFEYIVRPTRPLESFWTP